MATPATTAPMKRHHPPVSTSVATQPSCRHQDVIAWNCGLGAARRIENDRPHAPIVLTPLRQRTTPRQTRLPKHAVKLSHAKNLPGAAALRAHQAHIGLRHKFPKRIPARPAPAQANQRRRSRAAAPLERQLRRNHNEHRQHSDNIPADAARHHRRHKALLTAAPVSSRARRAVMVDQKLRPFPRLAPRPTPPTLRSVR